MLIPSTGIAFQQDLQNAFRCTHINQLLQTFKLCHFDLDSIDGGRPHQCPVFCTEQTVSDFFQLTLLLHFVLFTWKGSKSNPLGIKAFITMLKNF